MSFLPNDYDVPGQLDQSTAFAWDIDTLIAGVEGDGVLDGMAVTAAGTDLDVDVAAGRYVVAGTGYTFAGGSVTLAAADPTNPRIDLIYINTSNALAAAIGTPAAAPRPPAVPGDVRLRLGRAYVAAGATSIATSDLNDQTLDVLDMAALEWVGNRYERHVNSEIGNDLWPGTARLPKKTIPAALESVAKVGNRREAISLRLHRTRHFIGYPIRLRSGDTLVFDTAAPNNPTAGTGMRGNEIHLQDGAAVAVTGTASTDVIDAASHPFANGDFVRFDWDLAGGAGLETDYCYEVINATANDFQLRIPGTVGPIDFTTNITAGTLIRGNCNALESEYWMHKDNLLSSNVTAQDTGGSAGQLTVTGHGRSVGDPVMFRKVVGTATRIVPLREYEVHSVVDANTITIREKGDSVALALGGGDVGGNALQAGTELYFSPNATQWWHHGRLAQVHIECNGTNQDAGFPLIGVAIRQQGEHTEISRVRVNNPGNKTKDSTAVTGESVDSILDAVGHPFQVGDFVKFTALTGGAGLNRWQPYVVVETSYAANTFRIAELGTGTPVTFTTNITAATMVKNDGGGGFAVIGDSAPCVLGPTLRVQSAYLTGWWAYAADTASRQTLITQPKVDRAGWAVVVLGLIGKRGNGTVTILSPNFEQEAVHLVVAEQSRQTNQQGLITVIGGGSTGTGLSEYPAMFRLWGPKDLGGSRSPGIVCVGTWSRSFTNLVQDSYAGVTIARTTASEAHRFRQYFTYGIPKEDWAPVRPPYFDSAIGLRDGMTEPATATGRAFFWMPTDGLPRVKTGAGTVRRLLTDRRVKEITAGETLLSTDPGVINCVAGSPYTVNLPATAALGVAFVIRREGGSAITVGRNGSTIDGAAADKTLSSDKAAIALFGVGDGDWKVLATEGTVT